MVRDVLLVVLAEHEEIRAYGQGFDTRGYNGTGFFAYKAHKLLKEATAHASGDHASEIDYVVVDAGRGVACTHTRCGGRWQKRAEDRAATCPWLGERADK